MTSTAAIALLIFAYVLLIGSGVALLFGRVVRNRDRPGFSESDEQGSAHRDTKLDRATLPFGVVDHFHGGSSK